MNDKNDKTIERGRTSGFIITTISNLNTINSTLPISGMNFPIGTKMLNVQGGCYEDRLNAVARPLGSIVIALTLVLEEHSKYR